MHGISPAAASSSQLQLSGIHCLFLSFFPTTEEINADTVLLLVFHLNPLEKCVTFKDIFPALARTLQDFPGAK